MEKQECCFPIRSEKGYGQMSIPFFQNADRMGIAV